MSKNADGTFSYGEKVKRRRLGVGPRAVDHSFHVPDRAGNTDASMVAHRGPLRLGKAPDCVRNILDKISFASALVFIRGTKPQ